MNGYVFVNESGDYAKVRPESEHHEAYVLWVDSLLEATVFPDPEPWMDVLSEDCMYGLDGFQTLEVKVEYKITVEKWSK